MSHRSDCPTPWQAESQARDDFDSYGRHVSAPPNYQDCDGARRAYDAQMQRCEDDAIEERRAERRRQVAEWQRQEQHDLDELQAAEQREAEAELMEFDQASFFLTEYHFAMTEESRWADDGGTVTGALKFSPAHVGVDEGEDCNRHGCSGVVKMAQDPCYCHTMAMPPCSACTGSWLWCSRCDWRSDEKA